MTASFHAVTDSYLVLPKVRAGTIYVLCLDEASVIGIPSALFIHDTNNNIAWFHMFEHIKRL